MAFASSLDQVGVLCRSSQDLALTMDAIGGFDTCDRGPVSKVTRLNSRKRYSEKICKAYASVVVQELSGEGNSAEVLKAFERMKQRLESCGATLGEASLPNAKHGISAYYLVAPAEASANLARYDGHGV